MEHKFELRKTYLAILGSILILVLSFFVFKTNLFVTSPHESFLIKPISAIILPHHDLAAAQRDDVLRQITDRVNPKTIILVSPNHFNAGSYNILTTNRTFRLANTLFEPDNAKISELNLPLDDTAYDREHGILNQLAPLKNTFADAKIVPIIIKQDTPASQIDTLVNDLNKVCKADCLLVSSIDFSHYQSASVASVHDLLSIKALANLDKNLVWQAEVDSNPSLYLTIEFSKLKNANNFHLAYNTNSGLLEHAPDSESTSYILGWFEAAQSKLVETQTFTAGFDLKQFKDPRLTTGTDSKIDLNNTHDMAIKCLDEPDYCALNRILWGPAFYRDILNGLVVVGEIQADDYKLVLVPTKNGLAIRGDDKLAVINRVRERLGQVPTQINDGYDIIEISK